MSDLYRQHILDHYKRPRNFEVPECNGRCARGSNPSCGDTLELCIVIDDNFVKKATFQGSGCAISVAAASLLSEQLRGMTLDTAKALAPADVYRLLGIEVGPGREKCALLCLRALHDILKQR